MQIWDQALSQVKKMSVTVVTVGESTPYHNHLRMIYIGAGQHHHSHFDHHPQHHLDLYRLYRLYMELLFTDLDGRAPAFV